MIVTPFIINITAICQSDWHSKLVWVREINAKVGYILCSWTAQLNYIGVPIESKYSVQAYNAIGSILFIPSWYQVHVRLIAFLIFWIKNQPRILWRPDFSLLTTALRCSNAVTLLNAAKHYKFQSIIDFKNLKFTCLSACLPLAYLPACFATCLPVTHIAIRTWLTRYGSNFLHNKYKHVGFMKLLF